MRKSSGCKTVISYAAMGIGIILTGLLLIPAGILAIMIYTVWTVTDRIVDRCNGEEENGFLL
ncbi:MAG: hypothetical protein PUH33_07095 [Clostridiaceae bacterium]|nr:hypothetical protein [Clostridiaceae bacterium]